MCPYVYLTIPSYGIMAFVGGFSVLIFLFFRLGKYSITLSYYLKLFLCALVGLLFGSKLLYALTQIPWLIENYSLENLLMLIPSSGYVYYGGLFGVVFTVWFLTRRDKKKQINVEKLCIPAIPLFHVFGRIGCMLAGCCYGVELDNHFSIGILSFTRVPVQLIEAVFEFVLFVVMLILERRNSKLYSLKSYLAVYAVFRFTIEFWRGDTIRGVWFWGLSTSQLISIVIVLVLTVRTVMTKRNLAKCEIE